MLEATPLAFVEACFHFHKSLPDADGTRALFVVSGCQRMPGWGVVKSLNSPASEHLLSLEICPSRLCEEVRCDKGEHQDLFRRFFARGLTGLTGLTGLV